MADDAKSKIAELEKELYGKEFTPHVALDILRPKEVPATPMSWDTPEAQAAALREQEQSEKHHRMIKKIVIVSMGFFFIAAAIAGFIWWRGTNIISGENIVIDSVAPPAIAGGVPFESKFTITNNNKVSVEAATLFLEYPAGFYSVADKSELLRISKDLGVITPGQSVSESISAILYGEENTQKEVSIILEYRMAGSNATLKKTSVYTVRIASSPINIKLEMLKEASSGQEVEFSIPIGSNSQDPLDHLLLEAAYPMGFTFRSAVPPPTYGNNVWSLGTLASQEKRTIKIRGIIEGQEGETRVTKISIGTQSPKDERQIGVVYNATTESLTLTKPFLALDLAINGDRSPEYPVPLGRSLRVDVLWKSNSPTTVNDAIIEVSLKGEALNRYSIYADSGGFYQSITDSIIWNKAANPDLVTIEPGAHGTVSFSFSPVALGIEADRVIKNPQITIEVKAHARSAASAGVSGDVTTFATRKVNFESDLRLAVQSLYFTGPFKNTGPMPPQVEKETTYTIKWIVRNSSNSVSNVSAKTTLPIYVRWLGKMAPSGEDIAWDEAGAEVTWNVGRIPPGGTREAEFQVAFLPSLSQLRKVPYLTGDSILVGTDDFTKTNLGDRRPSVTTNLSSDPQFSQNQAAVVQ